MLYGRAVQLEAECFTWTDALHRALPSLQAARECFTVAGDAVALRGANSLLEALVAMAKGDPVPTSPTALPPEPSVPSPPRGGCDGDRGGYYHRSTRKKKKKKKNKREKNRRRK